MRGNVPSVVIAGNSRTFDDVWALRNLNAPAGATVQFDNGEVISFAGVLTAWAAVLTPFRRVTITAPAGTNVLVDVAYDQATAARMQPASQALPLDSSGNLQVGVASFNTSISQFHSRRLIASWNLAALTWPLEFGNRYILMPGGTFSAKVANTVYGGTAAMAAQSWTDVSGFNMIELSLFARGVTGAAPNFNINLLAAGIAEIRAAPENTAGQVKRQIQIGVTAGATDVYQVHQFGGGALEPLNGNFQRWGFNVQNIELTLDGGGGGSITGMTKGLVHLYGWN